MCASVTWKPNIHPMSSCRSLFYICAWVRAYPYFLKLTLHFWSVHIPKWHLWASGMLRSSGCFFDSLLWTSLVSFGICMTLVFCYVSNVSRPLPLKDKIAFCGLSFVWISSSNTTGKSFHWKQRRWAICSLKSTIRHVQRQMDVHCTERWESDLCYDFLWLG